VDEYASNCPYKTAWRSLNAGRMREYGIFKALASIRGHEIVAVDSTTVEAKKGRACRI
jgi:hypothetical protein